MKRIIYSIVSILLGSLSLVSCQDDNYDEPNSGIKGRFIDAETSELVPMPVQGDNGVRLRLYEKDRFYSTDRDHSELPVSFYAKIDGTYENSWAFSTDYLLTFEQTNFYPVDTIEVSLQGGSITEKDILVTPYARVSVVKAAFENKQLNVTYKISRSKADYKIENTFLAWHISPYVDKVTGNFMDMNSIDRKNTEDSQLLDKELTQSIDLTDNANFNKEDNKAIILGNGSQIFIRIGATTNGKVNYSTVVPVKVTIEK